MATTSTVNSHPSAAKQSSDDQTTLSQTAEVASESTKYHCDARLTKLLRSNDLQFLIPSLAKMHLSLADLENIETDELNELCSQLPQLDISRKLRFKRMVKDSKDRLEAQRIETQRNSDERAQYIIARTDPRVTNSICTIKLILLGDMGAGKTCIFQRFVFDHFNERAPPTIGVDFGNVVMTLGNNKLARLQLWDSAGQEKYESIADMYYRGCDGILIVYDISSEQSFIKATTWYHNVSQRTNVTDKFIVLVGNKCDKSEVDREVTSDRALIFANDIRATFLEVSAKTGKNVVTLFATAAKFGVEKWEQKQIEREKRSSVSVSNQSRIDLAKSFTGKVHNSSLSGSTPSNKHCCSSSSTH